MKSHFHPVLISHPFFTMSVMRYWNRLPGKAVDAPSLEVFMVGLDGSLSKLIQQKVSLPMTGDQNQVISKILSNTNCSVILHFNYMSIPKPCAELVCKSQDQKYEHFGAWYQNTYSVLSIKEKNVLSITVYIVREVPSVSLYIHISCLFLCRSVS